MSEIYEITQEILGKVFGGLHHLPNRIKDHGNCAEINVISGQLATTDFDKLTALVVLCHDNCIRMEIQSSGPGLVKLLFHKREREGHSWVSHPTMETAITSIRSRFK